MVLNATPRASISNIVSSRSPMPSCMSSIDYNKTIGCCDPLSIPPTVRRLDDYLQNIAVSAYEPDTLTKKQKSEMDRNEKASVMVHLTM